jgi:hypothetical protein
MAELKSIKAFITYEGLPLKSGGGHNLGAKQADKVYGSMLNFLKLYADTQFDNCVSIELSEFNLKNLLKYSLKLGMPSFSWTSYPKNGLKVSYRGLPNKKLDWYLDFTSNHDEMTLCVLWKFKFIDANSREILPGQTEIPILDFRMHNSQIYLRLSSIKSTASVWFAFPFDELTEDNFKYLDGIQKTLPFKFSKHSWRLWKKSKNDNWTPGKILM